MATGTVAVVASVAGVAINETVTETGDNAQVFEVSMPAGKVVTSWVKSDADTAACVLPGSHGYSDGKFACFWDGGRRYDVDGTIVTNALSLDGGVGDDFPDSATVGVVVCPPQEVNAAIDGDALQLLALVADQAASVYCEDADGDSIGEFELTADLPYVYYQSSGVATPLTGDPVTTLWVANGSATAGTLTILVLQDATP